MLALTRSRVWVAASAALVRTASARHCSSASESCSTPGASASASTSATTSANGSSAPRSASPDAIFDDEGRTIFSSAKDAMFASKVAKALREKVFAPDFQTKKANVTGKEMELIRLWRETGNHRALPYQEGGGGKVPSETGAMETQTTSWEGSGGGAAAATDAGVNAKSAFGDEAPVNVAEAYGQTFRDSRPTDPVEPVDAKRRRLIFQSRYRGMVEMDLILGHFARCRLANLDAELLDEYDTLLKQLDNDLFRWIIMGVNGPAEIESMRCFQQLRRFVAEERTQLLEGI